MCVGYCSFQLAETFGPSDAFYLSDPIMATVYQLNFKIVSKIIF